MCIDMNAPIHAGLTLDELLLVVFEEEIFEAKEAVRP